MSFAKLTHVWVEAPFFSDALTQLPADVTIIHPPSPKDPPEATALPAQAILASSLVNYNGALLDKLPNLRLIQRTGIGYDNVVVPDASAEYPCLQHAGRSHRIDRRAHGGDVAGAG